MGITLNINSNKMSHFSNVLAILKVSLYFGLIICVSISDVLKIEIRIYITAFGKQAGIILVNNIIMTLGSKYSDAASQKQHLESEFLFFFGLQKSLFCC